VERGKLRHCPLHPGQITGLPGCFASSINFGFGDYKFGG
jgi:hypothetical protein